MNKKIKSKKIHKTKLSKKLKSKSKSYKKISNRKISNKKISNRKKYNKKNYSKKIYRGGANVVPEAEAEAKSTAENSKVDRIAMFFDNDKVNFEDKERGLDLKKICPNVIKIKVEDNKQHKIFKYDIIIEQLKKLESEDEVVKNTYTNYIIDGSSLLWFDGVSGITTEQLNSLSGLFKSGELFEITDIILDFDRTFTLTEGLFSLPNILKITEYLYKPRFSEITDEEHEQNFINLIMGGKRRVEAMKNFLNICNDNNKKITILTNNASPLKHPKHFPKIINFVLGKDESEKLFIDIITTKNKDGLSITSKPKIISDMFCNSIDTKDLIAELRKNIPDLNIL
jgi:hypothetical protein